MADITREIIFEEVSRFEAELLPWEAPTDHDKALLLMSVDGANQMAQRLIERLGL